VEFLTTVPLLRPVRLAAAHLPVLVVAAVTVVATGADHLVALNATVIDHPIGSYGRFIHRLAAISLPDVLIRPSSSPTIFKRSESALQSAGQVRHSTFLQIQAIPMSTAALSQEPEIRQSGGGGSGIPIPASESDVDILRRQLHDIARMAGALVHEIRNPLSTMIMNLDLIREDLGTSEEPRDLRIVRKVERVRRESLRLQDLLETFLGIVKLEQITLESTDLNVIVEDFCDFFEPQAASHDVVLRRNLASGLPKVALNTELLNQTLLNLCLNAQQAMPAGGELILSTRRSGDRVLLEVTDTGKGIPASDLSRVFEPFYSTRKGGSGLGLPTCRRVAEAHHGTISVDSTPGIGTRFVLSFPLTAQAGGTGSFDATELRIS
jgi:signal transduction histidine kinase